MDTIKIIIIIIKGFEMHLTFFLCVLFYGTMCNTRHQVYNKIQEVHVIILNQIIEVKNEQT